MPGCRFVQDFFVSMPYQRARQSIRWVTTDRRIYLWERDVIIWSDRYCWWPCHASKETISLVYWFHLLYLSYGRWLFTLELSSLLLLLISAMECIKKVDDSSKPCQYESNLSIYLINETQSFFSKSLWSVVLPNRQFHFCQHIWAKLFKLHDFVFDSSLLKYLVNAKISESVNHLDDVA